MTTDWRLLDGSATAWFTTTSHAAGATLVARIAELTDVLPTADVRASGVRVRIAPQDLALAKAISAAAKALNLAADPAVLQSVHLTIDTADQPSLMPFWQTALAYDSAGNTLTDPLRREPTITFHAANPSPLRNRIHVDIVRPSEAVEAARPTLGEPYGAYGLTLADSEGNEIDLVPGDHLNETTTDWRTLFSAMAFYPTTSPPQATALATSAARLADDAAVPLAIDLRPTGVLLDNGKDQWESDDGTPVPEFTDLATKIQSAAHALDLAADPTPLRFVQLALDAIDVPTQRTFWSTLLGYTNDPRPFLTDIYDPYRLNPVMMFQQMPPEDAARRSRIHVTLSLPHDHAQPRIATAVAAGAKIIQETPTTCTLTDPEDNKIHLNWQPQPA